MHPVTPYKFSEAANLNMYESEKMTAEIWMGREGKKDEACFANDFINLS